MSASAPSKLTIDTLISSATTIKALGEVVIEAKWKETANQKRMERAVILPMECVSAPEVPEAFRALVEIALRESAEGVLKHFCELNPNSFEIPRTSFDRPNLTEFFLQRGEVWLSKEDLEKGFLSSNTWTRISSREEWKNNQAYRNAAEQFKSAILKLTGKAVQMKPEQCEAILAKIEEKDLENAWGAFAVKRLSQLAKKNKVEKFDISAL